MLRANLKKQRTGGFASTAVPTDTPSSSASSTRALPLTTVPALTTLCARVFVANLVKLKSREDLWDRVSVHLNALPDVLVPRIFAMLRRVCPTYLTHEFIATYLLRGPSVTLLGDMPGVDKRTIASIPRFNPGIRGLELSGFEKIKDNVFASLLRHLPDLRVLVLRRCSKVGAETAMAAGTYCTKLTAVNLNYTAVTPVSLVPLLTGCPDLTIIKIAGIQNWTDARFSNLIAGIGKDSVFPSFHTLKLRQTSLSDVSVSDFLARCPNLQRLDLSFTLVQHLPLLSNAQPPPLQKLSLTSTAINTADLIRAIQSLPQLRTLSLGAMGVNRGSQASISNSTAMTFNDDTLRALTDILQTFVHLEDISLVGNTKLGSSSKVDSALWIFLDRVGKKCKKLNLAGIPCLRSFHLGGLMPSTETDDAPLLETLILNNTGIDDGAAVCIGTCSSLETLAVAGTRMTEEGLFSIIDSCPRLQNLDLTSCRGVSVVDRRRFFEVWENARR